MHIQSPLVPKGELKLDTGRSEAETVYSQCFGLCDLLLQQSTVPRYADMQLGWDLLSSGPQISHLVHQLKIVAAIGHFQPDHMIEHPIYNLDQSCAHMSVLCKIASALPVVLDDNVFLPYLPGNLIGPLAFYFVSRRMGQPTSIPLPPTLPVLLLANYYSNLLRGASVQAALALPEFTPPTWLICAPNGRPRSVHCMRTLLSATAAKSTLSTVWWAFWAQELLGCGVISVPYALGCRHACSVPGPNHVVHAAGGG